MNSLNSILIEGNLVRDPAIHTTPKGTQVCTFSVASNRFFKQDSGTEREVSFFDIEAWSRLAESCTTMGKKGRGVRVVGRLKQDRWVGLDGKQHAKVKIVAEHVEFRPDLKTVGAPQNDKGNESGVIAEMALMADSVPGEKVLEEELTF